MSNGQETFQDEIKKRLDSLDEAQRNAIINPYNLKKLREIVQKHQMPIDKAVEFENEVLAVILGLHRARGFVTRLESILTSLPTTQIALEVEKELFQPVKLELSSIASQSSQNTLQENDPDDSIPPVGDHYREQPDTKPIL